MNENYKMTLNDYQTTSYLNTYKSHKAVVKS